jgi:HD-like signal output (HDOD) protein
MANTVPSLDREGLKPLEAILRRLSDCSGFPTLSTTISDVNRVVSSDSHSAQQITQVILRDVSLTTKLLQLVNSANYGHYRGRIRTVSKAVLILGCEAVRNAAMTLMMLEFSKGRSQERSLQDELIGAFFAGVLSKVLCQQLGWPNPEEAVICTMCQNLGKLLATFFLFEESRKIQLLVEGGLAEEQAAQQVLGISYRQLGVGVARHWNFPARLVEGMQTLTPRDMIPPGTEVESLRLAANLANDLYITALRTSQEDKPAALEALSKRYSGAVKLNAKELIAAIDQGLKEVAERSTTLNLSTAGSPALHAVRVWTGGAVGSPDTEQTGSTPGAADPLMEDAAALDALEYGTGASPNAQQVISAGIRDVTEALTSDFALNDVLRMVLETMHRGFGFCRTMIFIRDSKGNSMRARFGFGSEIERFISRCDFPLAFAPDVFHIALEKGVDIVIEDARADNIIQRVPEWLRQGIDPRSFLLLPIVLKSTSIGLLYADCQRAGIKLDAEQLGSLRTLRSQVVLAFKHCAASGRL